MTHLTDAQQKHLLMRSEYTLNTRHGMLRGRKVGFAKDHRGLGLVVVFQNGTRSFWGVNGYTLQLVDLGIPPPPPRYKERRPRRALNTFLLPVWR